MAAESCGMLSLKSFPVASPLEPSILSLSNPKELNAFPVNRSIITTDLQGFLVFCVLLMYYVVAVSVRVACHSLKWSSWIFTRI